MLVAAVAIAAVAALLLWLLGTRGRPPAGSYRELSPLAAALNAGSSPPTVWLNLGLWRGGEPYYEAAEALARAAADAAGLREGCGGGRSVVDVGCGLGQSLDLWAGPRYGARRVWGVNASAGEVRAARRLFTRPEIQVVLADAADLAAATGTGHDYVLCVDAAYHFAPSRDAFLRAARTALRPGGGIGLADITGSGGSLGVVGRAVCWLCGIPPANAAGGPEDYAGAMRQAGFERVAVTEITQSVFAPFAHWGRGGRALRARLASAAVAHLAAAGGLRFVIVGGRAPESLPR
eukprot:TRINITY_DN32022_c0_g1_i2.p1 TRINITY_DN32022_c0_g1~~TRINITY_DN32022_c0_g1_i2.p1  ORF type:complete len:315 (+),score=84.42 TRINITY_DN32022_c0_g1_i2:70-945(+)